MTKSLAYITLVLALAFAAAPFVTSPFTGFTADQLPNPQIDPPVQPAGYAFGIWGVIYLGLIGSTVFGVLRRATDPGWTAARPALIVSLAIGVPWLAIANASAIWATITIFAMAAGAILALVRSPARDIWAFRVPVGLYAGWLTAASCVSLATTMAGYGVAMGPVGWALAGIGIALLVAASVQTRPRVGPAYGLAVIWALVGIIVANGANLLAISALAAVGVLIIGGLAIRSWQAPAQT